MKRLDRDQHCQLVEILRDIHINEKDIRIIKKLYWGRRAEVCVGNIRTSDIDIQRGMLSFSTLV